MQQKMTLTTDDLNSIRTIVKEDIDSIRTIVKDEIDSVHRLVEENNLRLVDLLFKHFPTKDEVNDMMDRKLDPIKERLGIVEDIVSDIKLQIDRERISFIESTLETTQKRVGKLERRVDNLELRLSN